MTCLIARSSAPIPIKRLWILSSHFSQEALPSPSGDFLVGTTNFLVGNGIGPDKSTPVLSEIFLSWSHTYDNFYGSVPVSLILAWFIF